MLCQSLLYSKVIQLYTCINCIFLNILFHYGLSRGFPGSSAGKESACNAGDTSSIPGLGRCPGEGIGYPPQHSWASLVAQMVKNPPAMQETWVQSLGWEDSPGGEHGNLPQYSCLENLMDSAQRATAHRVAKCQT